MDENAKQKQILLDELSKANGRYFDYAEPKDSIYKIGEKLYALGGVELLKEIVIEYQKHEYSGGEHDSDDEMDDDIVGGLEYVWDGIGEFKVVPPHTDTMAPGILCNWGTLPPKPKTTSDVLGLVKFIFVPGTNREIEWVKRNIKYDGEILYREGDMSGWMNCSESCQEVEKNGVFMGGAFNCPDEGFCLYIMDEKTLDN